MPFRSAPYGTGRASNEFAMSMQLEVHGFPVGETIPKRFTCEGANHSPKLTWSGAPDGTRSFVLIMDDPDAPGGTWNHWLLWNIESSVTSLEEGVEGSVHGRPGTNDFGEPAYGGPCPPKGHGPHRYFFRLLALDVENLGLPAGARRAELDRAMTSHVLAEATYMGTYERR